MYDITTALCVTGHRPAGLPWGYSRTDLRLEDLKWRMGECLLGCAEAGVRRFITGMAQGVDTYFAEVVLDVVAEEYPDARLIAAVPFTGQEKRWPMAEQRRYHILLSRCHTVEHLSPWYTPQALQHRNEWMVNRAGRVLAVWNGQPGGTANTVAYARSLGREILCLPPVEQRTTDN